MPVARRRGRRRGRGFELFGDGVPRVDEVVGVVLAGSRAGCVRDGGVSLMGLQCAESAVRMKLTQS